MPDDDPREKVIREAIKRSIYEHRNHGADPELIAHDIVRALDAGSYLPPAQAPRALYIVQIEVLENDVMTHGFTSLHRTPEGAAKRLYDKAADWRIDVESDPQIISGISYLPIED